VLLDGCTLKTYKVERNDVLIGRMLVMELELWDRIERGVAPEPDFGHSGTYDLIREIHGVETGKVIDLSPEAAALWAEQAAIGKQISQLEKDRERLRGEVLHCIGDAAIARMPDGERELSRSTVKAAHVEYDRKEYIKITERKVKE